MTIARGRLMIETEKSLSELIQREANAFAAFSKTTASMEFKPCLPVVVRWAAQSVLLCLVLLALTGCEWPENKMTLAYVVQHLGLGEPHVAPQLDKIARDESMLIASNTGAKLDALVYGNASNLDYIIIRFPVISATDPTRNDGFWYHIPRDENPGLFLCSSFIEAIIGEKGRQRIESVAFSNARPNRRSAQIKEEHRHGDWKLEIEYEVENDVMNFLVLLSRPPDPTRYGK